MNKKGSAIVIISIVVGFLLIVGAIVAVILLTSNKIKEEESIEKIAMFIVPRDDNTKEQVISNYILEYKNNKGERVVVSEGKLLDSWNELEVPRDYRLQFSCWSDEYYLVKAYKDILPEEKSLNKSTFTCDMEKIGNPIISHTGDLSKIKNRIELNISTENNLNKLGLCFAWTPGIIDVSMENQFISCNIGNWTYFKSEKNNTYFCEENTSLQNCEFVEGNRCKLIIDNIPSRFKNKVDSCIDTGKSIRNESLILNIDVRTEELKNSLDNLFIYVYDHDRRFNNNLQSWEWVSELDGNDIGMKDANYSIKYEGACNENSCAI